MLMKLSIECRAYYNMKRWPDAALLFASQYKVASTYTCITFSGAVGHYLVADILFIFQLLADIS